MKRNYVKRLIRFFSFITVHFILINTINAQYCQPKNIGKFNVNYISNVAIGTINNSSNGNTGNYTYFSDIAATNVIAGEYLEGEITLTINGWNTAKNTVIIWLNFNESSDDDFDDDGERFLISFQDKNNTRGNKEVKVPFKIEIPSKIKPGNSILRVGYRTGNSNNFSSCDFKYESGEVEDYNITFISDYDEDEDEFEPEFCEPKNIGSFNTNYISNISFGSIDNTSSGKTGDYSYYSELPATDIPVGSKLEGTVTVTLNGWNSNTNMVVVWLNFNETNDDDFDDNGERFLFPFRDTNNTGGKKTVKIPIEIKIPETVKPSKSVIRFGLRTGKNENFTACDFKYQAGEIEDYKINFVTEEDEDEDTDGDGIPDSEDMFTPNPPASSTLDLDGVDDYLDSNLNLSGFEQLTLMAWVKLDETFSETGTLFSQGKLKVKVNKNKRVVARINGKSIVLKSDDELEGLKENLWTHITVTFNNALRKDKLKVFINGHLAKTGNDESYSKPIESSQNPFTMGKNVSTNKEFFNGDIDEVRLFNIALSDNQIQKIVYQEIKEDAGSVAGVIVPKIIKDDVTQEAIPWSSLVAYYPMSNIISSTTKDFSSYTNTATLYNAKTVKAQTAPMPFKTKRNGTWTGKDNWLEDVWDTKELEDSYFTIVRVSHDIAVNTSIKTSGLILDSGKTITLNGDNELRNSYYLELNGTIDLMNDSQLVQTEHSDLVTSSEGKILRRQEGTSSAFWYNYWAAPVGIKKTSALTNNNATTNNPNNTDFRLDMLKDDFGFNTQFTGNYTANGNISTYWLYTFINGTSYWDWTQITPSTQITPGMGYTQKGTGVPSETQQYIFEGKPNNGTILVPVKDKGGPGSVAGKSKTEFLLGNPYASAIDVVKFIDDNEGVIDGTIQLWQQWSGASHNMADYDGGYAQVNKLGGVRARQFSGLNGGTTGEAVGTVVPTRYLAVGQGFITEIVADGNVVFNNSQRVFVKEADADGKFNNGAVFSKQSTSKSVSDTTHVENNEDLIKKIRLEFNTIVGPKSKRELLLGFSDITSDAFDYGYEAETDDISNNDLNLTLEGKNMNIQAYSAITADKVVPLNFRSSGDNTFEIKISDLEHIDENQDIYLRDNLTGEYFDLRQEQPYTFTSVQGVFNERLEIVFQPKAATLSSEEVQTSQNYIYYDVLNNVLYAKKLNAAVTKFTIYSISGQSVMQLSNIDSATLHNGLQLPNMSSGTYIAVFRTDDNQVITKKFIKN
jgi:hypothetical protein